MLADPAPDVAPSGSDVAAILFLLIGQDDAAQLIGRLDPAEVRSLASAVYQVGDAGAPAIDGAIAAFVTEAGRGSALSGVAHDRLSTALDSAFGAPIAQGLLAPIAPPTSQPRFDRLRFLDAATLLERLADEHPQLIALVCAHVEPGIASAVIAELPEDEQEDIIFRLATLEPVSAEKLADAERLLMAKPARTGANMAARGGASDLAAILNSMGKGADKRALKALARRDRDLARRVEDEMLTFADLARLDDRALGTLLRSVDNSLLVPALKGAPAAFRARCLGCMSSRAAQTIEDELVERGPMPLAEVEAAQRAIVAVARRLGDEGVIQLGMGSGQGAADYV